MQRSSSRTRSGGFEKEQKRGSVSSPVLKSRSVTPQKKKSGSISDFSSEKRKSGSVCDFSSEKKKSGSICDFSSQKKKGGSICDFSCERKLNRAKTMPVSSDSSDSKPARERKSSPKATPLLQEKKSTRMSEMQQQLTQLQEELKREKQEKTRATEELTEAKRMLSLSKQANNAPIQVQSLKESMNQVEIWEREIEKAKDSERRMLESLIFQTKQLEQTKISLEEAKLEIRSLKENSKEKEINGLKMRIKSAVESEERSKKAMDDLAIALNDVSEEAKQVKCWLSESESELQKTRKESEMIKVLLANMESEHKLVSDQNERLKFEKEELVTTWNEKEKLFISCMKESETEINKAKAENLKLIESQRVIRDENSKLRDILKQAVNEANLVKETLETEKNENSKLKERITEKEKAFQTVKQDYECLKVSERSARDSLKELESMLDAKPTPNTTPPPNPNPNPNFTTKAHSEQEESVQPPQTLKNRRHSIGEPSKFNRLNKSERFVDSFGATDPKNNMVYATLSNVCDMRATSNAVIQELGTEYDYIDRDHFAGTDQYVRHKKKPILRRFSDIFRRKSIHGANFPPAGY